MGREVDGREGEGRTKGGGGQEGGSAGFNVTWMRRKRPRGVETTVGGWFSIDIMRLNQRVAVRVWPITINNK